MPDPVKKDFILDRLRERQRNLNQSASESRTWFRNAARRVTDVSGSEMMKDKTRLRPSGKMSKRFMGRMMMYFYDPKLKNDPKALPYYDMFPLILPLNIYNDGFLGINLHYLPRRQRGSLLNAIYNINYGESHLDEKRKLDMSYKVLNASSKHKWFRPAVKRYLYNHVRSKFYVVDPTEWDLMLFLPTERFVRASKEQVWADSLKMISDYKGPKR